MKKIIDITENTSDTATTETSESLTNDTAIAEVAPLPDLPLPLVTAKPRKPVKGQKKGAKKGAKGQKKGAKGVKVKAAKPRTDAPTTGQSREAFQAKYDDLSKKERKAIDFLNGEGTGPREAKTLAEIAETFIGTAGTKKRANSWARNSLRDLVPGGFVEKVDRGTYKITEAGRKRLARATEE
jgi:hypothetical protein